MEDEPPESQWLVLSLLVVGGDDEDRDGKLCWFMHWATAKPARQECVCDGVENTAGQHLNAKGPEQPYPSSLRALVCSQE